MPVLFQQVVAADSKYTFTNDPSCTVWDIHNDNPYNMGISLGRDTGILNADYYASPHSILYGVVAPGSNKYTIGGVKFTGTIYLYTQTPLSAATTDLSSAPASSITVIGYPNGSNPSSSTSLNRMSTIAKAINTNPGSTTEKPIFSATVGFGATVSQFQLLSIFNPPNSGVNFTFYAARAFSSDTTLPIVELITKLGADLNLPTAVAAVSHSGETNPPVSFSHCTATDSATGWTLSGNPVVEVMDLQANVTQDFLSFPDSVVLTPGASLTVALVQSGAGTPNKVVRLTMKWTEDIPVVQQGGVPTSIATQIIQDGQPAGNPLVESTPAGGPQGVLLTNDGKLTLGGNATFAGTFNEFFGNTQVDGIFAVLNSLQLNQAGTPVNGTSGNYTVSKVVWGAGLKILALSFNGYINNVSTDVLFPATMFRYACLPLVTAFTGLTFTFKNGVTGLAGRVLTALGTGAAAGSDAPATAFFPNSIYYAGGATAADRLTVGTSTTGVQGIVLVIGF